MELTLISGDGKEVTVVNTKRSKCKHGKLTYSEGDIFLTCEDCSQSVNPIVILERVLNTDSYRERITEEYKETLVELEKRNRTKCSHCKKMTSIIKKL